MARISLLLADARSLKDKRMVIRRIKDRVRERLVDHTAPPFGGAAGRGHAPAIDHTAPPFGGAAGRGHAPAIADRTGSGDKAVAGDDWVPAAWREESES